MIDLKKFCRKSHYLGNLTEPFSDENYTYASDGNILIRVDKVLEIRDTDKIHVLAAKKVLEENKIDENEMWINPPKFEIIEKNCLECKGTGKIVVCKECGGAGGMQFSNIYNVYDVECLSCNGKEVVTANGKCENCEGTGKCKEYSNPVRVIADIREGGTGEEIRIMLNGMYLEMIQNLPNVEIAFQNDSVKPVKLKFDGGIGLLMPMEYNKTKKKGK